MQAKNKTLRENCAIVLKKFTLYLCHQALYKKWRVRTGVNYTVFLDARNDGTLGTT